MQTLRMNVRGQLKCDDTRAQTRFRLSAKRTSTFKSAGGGASVQSTTGSRGVHISSSNAGYTMFRGSVKSTGYPLHSPVSPSLPLPCVTVCHHISTGLYYLHLQSCLFGNEWILLPSYATSTFWAIWSSKPTHMTYQSESPLFNNSVEQNTQIATLCGQNPEKLIAKSNLCILLSVGYK